MKKTNQGLKIAAVILASMASFLSLCSYIQIQLLISKRQAPAPQGILVLEGRTDRIYFTAKFAQDHSKLPIWVSGNPRGLQRNQGIFQRAGIRPFRIHYDFCAIDTVTNFTCTVRDLRQRNIKHIYVITSDYHMRRSRAIAFFVFGSRGILVTPISVTTHEDRSEAPIRIVRDCLRSIVWLITGLTGASLHRIL